MNHIKLQSKSSEGLTLVLGATGKTGQRVAARLQSLGQPIRLGSRVASPAFDWTNEAGWSTCLEGVTSVYLTYPSDLPVAGSTTLISTFVAQAKQSGIRQLVLLSGRGETEAQAWEGVVQESGLDWTIVRASWFAQNFSEGAFTDMVAAGHLTLPAGEIPEPFVDLDDIADVVVAALTQPKHSGQIYEVTGPRLLTFADATAELSEALGFSIAYQQIPHGLFLAEITASGAPQHVVEMMDYLFATVLDGRNANVTNGVQQALGRLPKDFTQFSRELAMKTQWRIAA